MTDGWFVDAKGRPGYVNPIAKKVFAEGVFNEIRGNMNEDMKARIAAVVAKRGTQAQAPQMPVNPAGSIRERYKDHIAQVEANQRAIAEKQK